MKNLLASIVILASTSAIVVPAFQELQELRDLRVAATPVVELTYAEVEARKFHQHCQAQRGHAEALKRLMQNAYDNNNDASFAAYADKYWVTTEYLINTCN